MERSSSRLLRRTWLSALSVFLTCPLAVSMAADPEPTAAPTLSQEAAQTKPHAVEVHFPGDNSERGTISSAAIRLHTAFGQVDFPVHGIQSIERTQDNLHLSRIILLNGNRMTGFVHDPIPWRPEDSDERDLAKTGFLRVEFQRPVSDPPPAPDSQHLLLKNGDIASGRLLSWDIRGVARQGGGPTAEQTEWIRFLDGAGSLSGLLRDGREFEGRFEPKVISFRLDLGQDLQIPITFVDRIFLRAGFIPPELRPRGAVLTEAQPPAAAGPPGKAPAGMVWIPPGRVIMGSPPDEKGRDSDEDPQTEVLITKGFWMGEHEVTQGRFAELMGTNPSRYLGDPQLPVDSVTWHEAVEYCARLTTRSANDGSLPEGFVFRLPTEAEWEYACRAGTTTRFSFGDDLEGLLIEKYAWFTGNSNLKPQPVGAKHPNPWGLFDMHGNVWEWCQDLWQDAYPGGQVLDYAGEQEGWLRIARGGSWLYDPAFSRSANRDEYSPQNRCSDIGFRVVLARVLPVNPLTKEANAAASK